MKLNSEVSCWVSISSGLPKLPFSSRVCDPMSEPRNYCEAPAPQRHPTLERAMSPSLLPTHLKQVMGSCGKGLPRYLPDLKTMQQAWES